MNLPGTDKEIIDKAQTQFKCTLTELSKITCISCSTLSKIKRRNTIILPKHRLSLIRFYINHISKDI